MLLKEFIDNLEQVQASEPDKVVVNFGDDKNPDYCDVVSVNKVGDNIVIDFSIYGDDHVYRLTEKMLFAMSLWEADVVNWKDETEAFEDKRVRAAWTLFKSRMTKFGYIVENGEERGKISESAPTPEEIFNQAIIDAKLPSSRNNIAYELFANYLINNDYAR